MFEKGFLDSNDNIPFDDTTLKKRCIHCNYERYIQDEYCMGCGNNWEVSYDEQPESIIAEEEP
jgi:hypothetical protein